MTLADLKIGQDAVLRTIGGQGELRHHLLDMGLTPGDEPTYRIIEDGAWPEDLPYATIHRMASAGQVRGIGQFCIDWCLRQGLPVRADTHADNVYMQRALEKSGFVRCGRIYTEDGSPRWAYYHKAATQKASPAGDAVRAADG